MGKRAKYAAVWVAVAATATVTGLAAGSVVRGAVGGDDATITLSQEQVVARLSGSTSGPGPAPTSATARLSPKPSATGVPHPSMSPTVAPTHGSGPTQSGGPTTHTGPPSKPPTSPPTNAPTPTPTPTSRSGLIYSSGGSVVAQCSGSAARIVSVSPAQGYHVATAEYGPAQELEVVFASSAGGQAVGIHITCRNGAPVGQVDDSGGE